MVDLSPLARYQRIKDLKDTWLKMTDCPDPSSSDDYVTWRHAKSYIYGQLEFYRNNAVCEHCGKYIVDRGDGFTHEEGDDYCELDETRLATPAHVVHTHLKEAA